MGSGKLAKNVQTKTCRGTRTQRSVYPQQSPQCKNLVEMVKEASRPLGVPLEEKIHTFHTGKRTNQMEWSRPWISYLECGQAKQGDDHGPCFLGTSRWDLDPFLERLLAAASGPGQGSHFEYFYSLNEGAGLQKVVDFWIPEENRVTWRKWKNYPRRAEHPP
jgi:hypothetical protein